MLFYNVDRPKKDMREWKRSGREGLRKEDFIGLSLYLCGTYGKGVPEELNMCILKNELLPCEWMSLTCELFIACNILSWFDLYKADVGNLTWDLTLLFLGDRSLKICGINKYPWSFDRMINSIGKYNN